MEPSTHQKPIQKAKGKFSILKEKYTILEPVVENIIMYMPVEDETEGGTPMLSNTGLNMAPPPSPKAPAAHPPIKAKSKSFRRFCQFIITSLSAKPFPKLYFKCCSCLTVLIAKRVALQHTNMKLVMISQSV